MSEILERLKEPFPPERISWRVGKVVGNRCLALAYIDARDVMQRLDEVVGGENWQCTYPHAGDKTVCSIGIKIGGEWVWKANGAGDTDIEGEKGALSDAFKRAAVLWGIGRYLYYLDTSWADYNPDTKKIVKAPELPAWARPQPKAPPVDAKVKRAALGILEPAAAKGLKDYQLAWETLSPEMKRSVKDDHPGMKALAEKNSKEASCR